MFTLDKAMNDLYSASEAMQKYADDAIVQEQYRAALEIYRKNLELQTQLAHEFLRTHQETNKKIFQDAISYLDIAIEHSNVRLAESALKLIEVMKEKESGDFKKYYQIRFGK